MNHLSYYKGKNTVFSFSKHNETCNEMLGQSLHVLFFFNNHAVFLPENRTLNLLPDEAEYFNIIEDYSVFQLSGNGRLHLYYDVNSADNPLIITDRCNSNCIMCPLPEKFRRESRSMKLDDLLVLAHHIPNFTEHITITGGEPFLIRKDIFVLLSYLKSKFFDTRFLMLTNGRALASAEYANLFANTAPNHIVVGIPIHGSTAEQHDCIVRASGGFNETILGIKHLIDLGIPVELRLVVSKLNANDITSICRLIVSTFPHVLCVKIMGLEMLGNAAINQSSVWIPYREAFLAIRNGIELLISSEIDVGLYNFPLCAVDKQYWPICEKSISDYKVRFPSHCEKCKVKDGCGGIFAGTIRLAKNDVHPINSEL